MSLRKDLVLAVVIALALIGAALSNLTPKPLGLDAPSGVFSAGRAMVDNRIIAKAPHPMGSPANYTARDYLISRMTALGLSPQIQRTDAFRERPGKEPWVTGGVVENIVGVLPGADRSAPALALMAHYDSVPGSPGAADDAAGVAAGLEIMRILKAQGTPARDVILLLTDGEESGLLGATAFFQSHPLAARVGFVINMESRGGGGRARMFETSADNGGVVQMFRGVAPSPDSSSLTVFLYKKLPNDTDFTVPRQAGIPGLNYAFIARQFDYHSPMSTPDHLQQGSLQHLGSEVLATAREVAFAKTLPKSASDRVFGNTVGSHLLSYRPLVGWGLLLGIAGLLALGIWRARQAGAFQGGDVARGAGATLYLVLTSAVLFMLARHATGAGFGFLEQQYLLARPSVWEAGLALVGFGALLWTLTALSGGRGRLAAAGLALGAGVLCSAFAAWSLIGVGIGGAAAIVALLTFGRAAGVAGAWTGALGLGLLAAVALQIMAPTAAFLVAWPLAIAALAAAASAMGTWRPIGVVLLIAGLAALALHWVLYLAHGVFIAIDLVQLQALFVFLAALLLWPLVQTQEGEQGFRNASLVLLIGAGLIVGLIRFLPPWSERHPQPSTLAYVIDGTTGQAKRFSFTPNPPQWAKDVLRADGGHVGKDEAPFGLRGTSPLSAWAKPITPLPATVTLTRPLDGSLAVRIVPPAGATSVVLGIRPTGRLTDATINGRPAKILGTPGQWSHVRWAAAPEGVVVGFRAKGPGTIEARYAAITPAWPKDAKPLPPRPATISANGISGSTIVTGTQRLTW